MGPRRFCGLDKFQGLFLNYYKSIIFHSYVPAFRTFLFNFFNFRIHPEVLPHSADVLSRDFNGDLTSLKAMFESRPVVASTCLGINHPAIAGRTFDYCIFDEAGQALLLATLGPLFHCDKFVLVGDPQQLPPVVQVIKEHF